jgi:hypothetical protein
MCLLPRKHHSEAAMAAVVVKVAAAEAAGEIGPWEEMDSPDELMTAPPELPKEWIQAHQLWVEQQQEEGSERAGRAGTAATTTSSSSSSSSSRNPEQQKVGSGSLKNPKQGLAGGAHVGCACHGTEEVSGKQQQQKAGKVMNSSNVESHPPSSSSEATANGSPARSIRPDPEPHNNTSSNSSSSGPSDLPLMVAPGVLSQRHYPHLQATELMLVNGMRVCFKETDFFKDEVLISGVAIGGLSEVNDGS